MGAGGETGMARQAQAIEPKTDNILSLPAGANLVEWYFEQGWTDGLPVVPPTRGLVDRLSPRSAATPSSSNAGCRRAMAACRARCWRSTW